MRNGSLCFSQTHTLAARQTYYRRLTDVLFAYILSLVCSRGIVPFCNESSDQITQPVLQWREAFTYKRNRCTLIVTLLNISQNYRLALGLTVGRRVT